MSLFCVLKWIERNGGEGGQTLIRRAIGGEGDSEGDEPSPSGVGRGLVE